jgi:pimeloyl-ACP methyl ester carboxylesterase
MLLLRYIAQLASELFLMLFYPLLTLTRFSLPLSQRNPQPTKKTPIIIVERWFTPNPLHILLKDYLEERGFQVYIMNFPILRGDFQKSALKLKGFIDQRALTDFVLVGISFGAITSLLYLQELQGWSKTKRFIAIGAPFNGTLYAYLFFFIKSFREMVPESDLTKRLTQTNDYPEKTLTLEAVFDQFVTKESGRLPKAPHLRVNILGHNNLHVFSTTVYEEIRKQAEN